METRAWFFPGEPGEAVFAVVECFHLAEQLLEVLPVVTADIISFFIQCRPVAEACGAGILDFEAGMQLILGGVGANGDQADIDVPVADLWRGDERLGRAAHALGWEAARSAGLDVVVNRGRGVAAIDQDHPDAGKRSVLEAEQPAKENEVKGVPDRAIWVFGIRQNVRVADQLIGLDAPGLAIRAPGDNLIGEDLVADIDAAGYDAGLGGKFAAGRVAGVSLAPCVPVRGSRRFCW